MTWELEDWKEPLQTSDRYLVDHYWKRLHKLHRLSRRYLIRDRSKNVRAVMTGDHCGTEIFKGF